MLRPSGPKVKALTMNWTVMLLEQPGISITCPFPSLSTHFLSSLDSFPIYLTVLLVHRELLHNGIRFSHFWHNTCNVPPLKVMHGASSQVFIQLNTDSFSSTFKLRMLVSKPAGPPLFDFSFFVLILIRQSNQWIFFPKTHFSFKYLSKWMMEASVCR